MNEVLWRPSKARIQASRMDAFRRQVNQQFGLALRNYADLHRWSIEQRAAFWQTLADYFQVRWPWPESSSTWPAAGSVVRRWSPLTPVPTSILTAWGMWPSARR